MASALFGRGLFRASTRLRMENAELLHAQAAAAVEAARAGIKLKATTGLVGIPVQPRWRDMMLKLIDDVLEELDQRIPKQAFYRVATENNFRHFRRVVESSDDYEVVEDTINRGQVEELIMMFEDELQLITKMQEWQPWHVDAESIALEKEYHSNGADPQLPDNFAYPYDQFKYVPCDMLYDVEYSQQELDAQKKAAEEAAAAAAAAAAQKAEVKK